MHTRAACWEYVHSQLGPFRRAVAGGAASAESSVLQQHVWVQDSSMSAQVLTNGTVRSPHSIGNGQCGLTGCCGNVIHIDSMFDQECYNVQMTVQTGMVQQLLTVIVGNIPKPSGRVSLGQELQCRQISSFNECPGFSEQRPTSWIGFSPFHFPRRSRHNVRWKVLMNPYVGWFRVQWSNRFKMNNCIKQVCPIL